MQTAWTVEERKLHPSLLENISCDVVIIGGGITGIISAYLLSQAGQKVVLLEKGILGKGATSLTTAFLTQAIDTSLFDLVKMFGRDSARMVWQSGMVAIETIRNIIEQENIQCDFETCPAYIYAETDKKLHELEAEYTTAKSLNFQVKLMRDRELSFKNVGYLKLSEQAKFHPLKFILAMADRAIAAGAHIYENTEVIGLTDAGDVEITVGSGAKVKANDVIIATYIPFNKPRIMNYKTGMYRSYVLQAHLPHSELEEAIYWDKANPYNYFRIDRDGDGKQIIIGGADHRIEIPIKPRKNFDALESRLKNILDGTPYTITRKWFGPILESSDGLPFIGTYKPHRHIATAFSGNGMTYSTVAALLFRDILLDKTNSLTGVYDPTRKLTAYRLYIKGSDYIRRFFGGALKNTLR